jgi:processive 1,2-diacylglycerol beta-glucosyltransferase
MKILITYAYAGVGHKKAAEAVFGVLSEGKNEVKIVDALDYTNPFFRFSYPRVYLFLINRLSFLWGWLYYFFDLKSVDFFAAPLRAFFHALTCRALAEFIKSYDPDVIISTHFLPGEVVSGLKRKGLFKGKLITIITDFLPHAFWMAENTDCFIAAIDKTKKDLICRGVKEESVKVLGIPCEPKFSFSNGRKKIIEKLKLEHGFFNLLVMGGGFGTGPVREIIDSFTDISGDIKNKIQIMVICGKNKVLFEDLNRMKSGSGLNLRVFAYMDNIDEFMEASDCIVTKSGGLTVSEALSKKLPMIIISPIPGQETRNCEVLTDYGAALRAGKVTEIRSHVMDFIRFPEKITGMKAGIDLLYYPDSAKKIAEFVLNV